MVIKKDKHNFKPLLERERLAFEPLLPQVECQIKNNKKIKNENIGRTSC